MRILPFVLVVFAILAGSSPGSWAAGDTIIRDLKNTKVIRSHEAPHNILSEACVACHPKEKFDFWLLIYRGKPPAIAVEGAEEKQKASAAGGAALPAAPRNRYNSHDGMGCGFCHFGSPTAAEPKFIVDARELCRLCHPGVEPHRLPEGADAERVAAVIASKRLPGAEGKILCTTCHQVHDSTYGLREAYVRTLWEGRVPDPHGKRSLCFACHPGGIKEGETIRLTGGKGALELCNDCHLRPGVRRSPHVVDVPSTERTWRMDYLGYPLNGGKLTCSTCHDEVSHGRPDPANPKFLRGGPYDDPEAFCYRCHLDERANQNNPHNQIDQFGRIREAACRSCHRPVADPSKTDAWAKSLVTEGVSLCSSCHPRRPHPDADHIRPITAAMRARKQEYEARHQVRLPLADDGTIMCSTCHNPHAKGVLKGEAGVGASSKWRVADFREVCAPCHGRY